MLFDNGMVAWLKRSYFLVYCRYLVNTCSIFYTYYFCEYTSRFLSEEVKSQEYLEIIIDIGFVEEVVVFYSIFSIRLRR